MPLLILPATGTPGWAIKNSAKKRFAFGLTTLVFLRRPHFFLEATGAAGSVLSGLVVLVMLGTYAYATSRGPKEKRTRRDPETG